MWRGARVGCRERGGATCGGPTIRICVPVKPETTGRAAAAGIRGAAGPGRAVEPSAPAEPAPADPANAPTAAADCAAGRDSARRSRGCDRRGHRLEQRRPVAGAIRRFDGDGVEDRGHGDEPRSDLAEAISLRHWRAARLRRSLCRSRRDRCLPRGDLIAVAQRAGHGFDCDRPHRLRSADPPAVHADPLSGNRQPGWRRASRRRA
jgi:hypothetical protein